MRAAWRSSSIFLLLGSAQQLYAQARPMQPEDLFRIERVGAIAWSPDSSRAAVELHRPGRWFGCEGRTDVLQCNA